MPARPALAAAAVAVVLAACDRSPTLATCADHLGGVWQTADGSARWHILDGGERLQAYPLVRELPAMPTGTQAAPSTLDLRRSRGEVVGTVIRRWHRGGEVCVVRAPARIRGCAADRLTLTFGDTGPPTDWTACRVDGPTTAQLLQRTWP